MKHRRYGECMFCGNTGALTKEDALPRWIGRQVHKSQENRGIWESMRVAIRPNQAKRRHTKLVGNPSAVKLPIVCAKCNNIWMSALERAVKPILAPMIDDKTVTLNSEQQTTLTSWFTKTALVHERIEFDAQITEEQTHRLFYNQRQPLPKSVMRLARYNGESATVLHARRTITLKRAGLDGTQLSSAPQGQLFTLVIRRVVLQIMLMQPESNITARCRPSDNTVQIWPLLADATWPPSQSLDDSALIRFTNFEEVGGFD